MSGLILEWLATPARLVRGAVIAYVLLAAVALIPAYLSRSRPAIAAAWSAAVPGLGQWYAGARWRAVQFLAIDVGMLLLGYLAIQDRDALLRAAVVPRNLVLAMIASLVILTYRIWAAYDAFILIRGERPAWLTRSVLVTTLTAVGFLLAAPHAVFGYYDMVHYNFLTTVFRADDPVASPTTTTTTSAGPTTTGDPANPTSSTTSSTTTTTRAPAIWDGLERLNVLLIGADVAEGRSGIRTDTMIVVSIDPESGDTAMFSVPRNYSNAPLPEGLGLWECQCFPRILNGLYSAALANPEAFPGPGTPSENAIKGALGEILGLEIHYYAMVNLEGFIGVIDALGGVEINVPSEIVEESYGGPVLSGRIVIPEGLQEMDGATALAYSRIRSQSSDYARMNRQRCVVKAVIDQSTPGEMLAAYPSIAGVLREQMQTDIPISRLPDFIDLLPKVDTDKISALSITPSGGYLSGSDERGQNIYDAELIRAHVALILEGRGVEVDPTAAEGTLIEACN